MEILPFVDEKQAIKFVWPNAVHEAHNKTTVLLFFVQCTPHMSTKMWFRNNWKNVLWLPSITIFYKKSLSRIICCVYFNLVTYFMLFDNFTMGNAHYNHSLNSTVLMHAQPRILQNETCFATI